MLLRNNVALITGASRGIGYSIAELFAGHGAFVMLTGRSLPDLQKAEQAIRNRYPESSTGCCELDVADPDSVRNAFQALFKLKKRLDVMVANAGVLDDALIGMVSRDNIERVFSTNVYGVIYCAQYASRLMARNGQGSIISISSIIGTNGNAGQTVYGASKAAVLGITKSLAKEMAPQNVRVNSIAPGFIDTQMARSLSSEKFSERVASVKMGRIGSPEEVANVALFLASNLSSYVTGQTIGVDGGMLI
jgi:3-oxoacyl-[acyl-carrier protein] reductase